MLSEMFLKLWNNGILQRGIWETIYMTVLSTAISYVIGLPLGVVLTVTDKGGLHPIPWLNRLLGIFVNFFRSIPFIILMVAMPCSSSRPRPISRAWSKAPSRRSTAA